MNHRLPNRKPLRRTPYKLASLYAILLIASSLQIDAAPVQHNVDAYQRDNSDWWSYTRRPDSEDDGAFQKRELSAKHFKILGLMLSDDAFYGATKKLGEAVVVKRGDAS